MARFAVKGTFAVTGRGFVLAGDVVDGTLRKGMRIQRTRDGRCVEFEIIGVEFIDFISERRAEIGLLLPLQDVRLEGLDDAERWVGSEYECI